MRHTTSVILATFTIAYCLLSANVEYCNIPHCFFLMKRASDKINKYSSVTYQS